MTEKEAIEYLKRRYLVVDRAIKALRRQIPIKPVTVLGSYDKPEYECQNCGDTIPDNMYEFCPYCGQAIDWSDWDERN